MIVLQLFDLFRMRNQNFRHKKTLPFWKGFYRFGMMFFCLSQTGFFLFCSIQALVFQALTFYLP